MGSVDATGKAITRPIPPASSCITTAQPGRISSPRRPAGRLLAWQTSSAPERAAVVKAVVEADAGERLKAVTLAAADPPSDHAYTGHGSGVAASGTRR